MKIQKLTPNFAVNNIKETVQFYENVLGFSLVMAVPETQDGAEESLDSKKEYVYALMARDAVQIMFQREDSFREDIKLSKDISKGALVSFYMEVEGVEGFYSSVKEKVEETTEIKTTWYGMKEFYIKDLDGYILGFAEKVK